MIFKISGRELHLDLREADDNEIKEVMSNVMEICEKMKEMGFTVEVVEKNDNSR